MGKFVDMGINNMVKRINRKLYFWIFDFIFWLSHWLAWLLISPNYFTQRTVLLYQSLQYVSPILSTLGLRYLYKKYNLHRLSLPILIILIIIFSILCGTLWVIGQRCFEYLLFDHHISLLINDRFLRDTWYQTYSIAAWSALYFGFKFYEEFINQKHKAERSELLVQSAQLEMLRYQLNPHFLFNTLSSLRALIRRKENQTAEDMVTKISEFLKYSLLEGEANKVPLAKEIKTINHYFDIEKVRFGDQLIIDYDIDPRSESFAVPVFILHPLIENAVKHGMKTSKGPLQIVIRTKIINDKLIIEIINSGCWIKQDFHEDSTHTGLENTRKRLTLAYPDNHTLEIIKKQDTVHIKISINPKEN